MEARILAIETSCDETSIAVMEGNRVLANVISSQVDHEAYGGVIPELASRLHQQFIISVCQEALDKAQLGLKDIQAIAFTRGPGLLGALLVGTSFAKGLSIGLGIPLIEVNHMEAHVLANFLMDPPPEFPFLCLTVSGGHTQLVLVEGFQTLKVIGETIDDAAGEAFDKGAKMLGLPYPGGPHIDKLAKLGDSQAFSFPTPRVGEFEFSFSGLKTSLLYLLQREMKKDPEFIKDQLTNLCASYQHKIVSILLEKLEHTAQKYGITQLAIAGGVSANSELRESFTQLCHSKGWRAFIPDFEYCTDNAAMIGIAALTKFKAAEFSELSVKPFARNKEL